MNTEQTSKNIFMYINIVYFYVNIFHFTKNFLPLLTIQAFSWKYLPNLYANKLTAALLKNLQICKKSIRILKD